MTKRIIFLTVVLALVATLGLALPASAASYTITVSKAFTGMPPGFDEDFTFEAWRDVNNNGVIDAGDLYKGSLTLHGGASGATLTGSMTVGSMGAYVVREVYTGTYWVPDVDKAFVVSCPVTVTFTNVAGEIPTVGTIVILKQDPDGNILAVPGAVFRVCPNPYGAGCLDVQDNLAPDEDPTLGRVVLGNVPDEQWYEVTEIQAPAGYQLDPTPQSKYVATGGTAVFVFVNTPTCVWGGTPGFWSSKSALNKFSMATLAGWFNDIVLDSAWFEDSLVSSNNAIAYSRMVAILKNTGGGTYEETVGGFQSQYLATRLNAKSGYIPLPSVHVVTSIAGAEVYFGFASGTLATIIATIESKADGAILLPPPAQSDLLIMKAVCDRLNNGLI